MLHSIYSAQHHAHASDQIYVDGQRFECHEVPARAECIRAALHAANLGPIIPPTEHGAAPLYAVHETAYLDYVRHAYQLNAAQRGKAEPLLVNRAAVTPLRAVQVPQNFTEQRAYYTFDHEDPILAGTWEAAYWSAQCALTGADLLRSGEQAAYALCRPPGHHATRDQYGGYCYLNNAAIAARALQHGDTPVAILDLDYHHGNGTQDIFYRDPKVLYVSLHADPALDYPYYWGYRDEVGSGAGRGTNHNFPLPLGVDDTRYLATLDTALRIVRDFAPRFLVISLGVDALGGDRIGKFALTLVGWQQAAQRIAALGFPTLLVQEGGYGLEQIGAAVVTFVEAFC